MKKPHDAFTRFVHKSCQPKSIYRAAILHLDEAATTALQWLKANRPGPPSAHEVAQASVIFAEAGDGNFPLKAAALWFERAGLEPTVGDLCALARQFLDAAGEIDEDLHGPDADDVGEDDENGEDGGDTGFPPGLVRHLAECPECWGRLQATVEATRSALQAPPPTRRH